MADIVDGLDRRPALAFCMSVATVQRLTETLADRGHRVAGITGTTDDKVRAEALAAYAAGDLDVLVNCGVLTEGTDLPRTSEIVLGRPCGSKSLYIQIVGRGARLYPGKESFRVWDVLGASKEHTLVSSVVLDIGRDDAGPRYVAGYDHQTPDYTAPQRSVWAAEPVHGAEPPLLRLTAPLPAMAGRPAGVMHREGPHVVEMAGWAPMGRPVAVRAGRLSSTRAASAGRGGPSGSMSATVSGRWASARAGWRTPSRPRAVSGPCGCRHGRGRRGP